LGVPDISGLTEHRSFGEGLELFLFSRVTSRQVEAPVLASVDRDSVNPSPELRVPAKLVDRLENLDEDLLGHVLGLLATPEHSMHQAKDAIAVELHELVERPLVTSDEALDEALFGGVFGT
jgi:hypothetical protein